MLLQKEVRIMNIIRWSPYREVDNVIRTMGRLMEDDSLRGCNQEPGRWSPAVDIEEDEQQVLLKAEMPGFNPDEIDINLKEGMLEIKAQTNAEEEKPQKNFIRRERRCGFFYRAFELADELDISNAKATYKNGVLELVMMKKAKQIAPEFKVKVSAE
jgi:HSP20 family protein